MEKHIYDCYERGVHSIKQVIQSDGIIWINTIDEQDSNIIFQEEIHYDPHSCCIESYKCHRNHLLIDSFVYCPGKIFMPNNRARQYKGFSAENAYSLHQAILLLPRINRNSRVLLYDHKTFSFSALLFLNENRGITDNTNGLVYKIISPIVAVAEYEPESKLLRIFQSRDLCLTLIDTM